MKSEDRESTKRAPWWVRWAPWWPTVLMCIVALMALWPGRSKIAEVYGLYAIESVGSAVIGLVVGLAIRMWHDQRSHGSVCRRVVDELTNTSSLVSLLQHIQHIDDIQPYCNILAKHVALENLMPVFTQHLKDIFEELSTNGLVLVEAGNHKYLEILQTTLGFAQKSFKAVLIPPYYPSWFFKNDARLTGEQKRAYLKVVATAEGFLHGKLRLLLFEWDDPTTIASASELLALAI